MMQVWGKVSKYGCKIINPGSERPYLRFYLIPTRRMGDKTIMSINWWHWDWEPKPAELVKATGFFEIVEANSKSFMNLYIYGNVHADDPLAVVPGVKAERSPDWKEFPYYAKGAGRLLTGAP